MRISIRGKLLLVGACMLAGVAAGAQQAQYSVNHPPVYTDVAVTFAAERADIVPGKCCFWMEGAGVDAALTFWKGQLGIAGSLTGDHVSNYAPGLDVNKITFLGGPRYTYTIWPSHQGRPRVQIFGQGLFGGVHGFDGAFPSSAGLKTTAGSFALQTGGGVNLFFTRRFGLRLIEADYVRTALSNGSGNTQDDLRLAAGVTYEFSPAPAPPVTLACSVSPVPVFPGDPVTATATAGGLNPKLNAIYSWAGDGVTGSGATATVATGALAPGAYTVKGSVKEGKAGKEGLKPGQAADCSASFTVRAFEPPTLSCAANPATINPGGTSSVSASGMSPQNRPLTYSYTASAGTIAGNGATAVFNSAGAPTGTTGITCNVSDDKGQTATASTSVTITAPYVAPVPHTQALCSITFETDKKRPARVDNEAKACLDEVALSLQRQSDAKVVVVGEANSEEKTPKKVRKHAKAAQVEDLAAERAVNTKDYLVTEKGIDATRVSVATSSTDGQKVEDYLVPAGASFAADVQGTTPVDEAAVKAQPRKPLETRPAHKKSAPAMK
jgi:outer membrane protein OmpA-like peptidoglycan-associated protein